jgi:S-adenosylmethionine:tRNA ribosyltransferase-isomerase
MHLSDFDFELPEELIALEPAPDREGSRLLHVGQDAIGHHRFAELPDLLREGDVLVLNNTRVFPAALRAVRPARSAEGGDVAVDLSLVKAVETAAPVRWRAFARPGKRLAVGDILVIDDTFRLEIVAKDGAEIEVRFDGTQAAFDAALDASGQMPLPPYIARRRPAGSEDRDRYQTVYAQRRGSVAAPTAGLHFTEGLLDRLGARGIDHCFVTLHVGPGTFLPVTVDKVEDHRMHAEWGEVPEDVAARLNRVREEGGRIVAVGTTSTRLLESAASSDGQVVPFTGETDIFITPGYAFRAVDALITNFHLPRSTLLMLVSAFAGTERIRTAYAEAIAQGYRFYSYGDACLLERAA